MVFFDSQNKIKVNTATSRAMNVRMKYVFVRYSHHSELTISYTADDRYHLFGAVRQYSICVKISQSTLVPLKSVKSLRTKAALQRLSL